MQLDQLKRRDFITLLGGAAVDGPTRKSRHVRFRVAIGGPAAEVARPAPRLLDHLVGS